MNLIFMLTRNDQTVAHCLDAVDQALALGVSHVGFKDIGVSQDIQAELNRRIKAAGATSYLEVVSETPEACLASAVDGGPRLCENPQRGGTLLAPRAR